jgi:hypothetical protein
MLGRGHGVKEAATQADVIKLFPATAFSVRQDALYPSFMPDWRFTPFKPNLPESGARQHG